MNSERFVAANVIALITHSAVLSINNIYSDLTLGHGENQISDALRGQDFHRFRLSKRLVPILNYGGNSSSRRGIQEILFIVSFR